MTYEISPSDIEFLSRPETEDALINQTQKRLVYDDPRQYQNVPNVVRQAVQFGFITLGYDYVDYMREAVHGVALTDDPQGPRKKGFIESLYWAEQGCLTKDSRIIIFEKSKVIVEEIGSLNPSRLVTLPSYSLIWNKVVPDVAIVIDTGFQDIYEIKTSKGPIYCTGLHPFFTYERGWQTALELKAGDRLLNEPTTTTTIGRGSMRKMPWDLFFDREGARLSTVRAEKRAKNALLLEVLPYLAKKSRAQSSLLFSLLQKPKSSCNRENAAEKTAPGKGTELYHEDYFSEQKALRQSRVLCPNEAHFTRKGSGSGVQEETARDEIENVFSPSRAFTQFSSEKRSNDSTGKKGGIDSPRFRSDLHLESLHQNSGQALLPRFPPAFSQSGDRVQWEILARRSAKGRFEEGANGGRGIYGTDVLGRRDIERAFEGSSETLILSISRIGKESTYNLHVLGNNNFFLDNGTLTHNCGKTSLSWQDAFKLQAGNPEKWPEDFDQDKVWEYTFHRMILRESELKDLYKEIQRLGPEHPIPNVTIDDITTSVPKHLWFTKGGIRKFAKLHQFIAAVRPFIKVLSFSTPFPENLVSVLTENLKMEIIVYPNNTHMVERYVRFVNPRAAASSILRKIVIEFAQHELAEEHGGVPREWWQKYEEESFNVRQELTKELEAEGEDPVPEAREFLGKTFREIFDETPEKTIVDTARNEKGVKVGQSAALQLLRMQREFFAQKLGLKLEEPKWKEEVTREFTFKAPELSEEEKARWTNLLSKNSKRIQS